MPEAVINIEPPLEKASNPIRFGVKHGTFFPNIVAQAVSFVVSIGITLWLTPLLIRKLGSDLYGLVPLSLSVVSYMSVLDVAVSTSVSRSLTQAYANSDAQTAQRILSSALTLCCLTAAILVIPAGLATGFLNWILTIPEGALTDAKRHFGCVAAAFILSTATTPFAVSAFCRNRFDISHTITILGNLARILVIVGLFAVLTPNLSHVGVGILLAAIVSSICSVVASRRISPGLRPTFSHANRRTIVDLLATGWWVSVFQVGSILLLSIDLLVVNRALGAEAGGRYAIVLQWAAVLRSVSGSLSAVFSPTILALYAKGDMDSLVEYASRGVRFVGYIISIPIGVLCGFSTPFLAVWVGPEYSSLSPLLSLLIAPLCVNLAVMPMFAVSLAANKVRLPGVITLILGVLNLPLAYSLCAYTELGMVGVALAGIIVLTLKNALFTPMYAAHNIGKPWYTFVKSLAPIIPMTAILAFAAWSTSHYFTLNSWSRLIGAGAALSAAYCLLIFTIALNLHDRQAVAALLKRSLRGIGLRQFNG